MESPATVVDYSGVATRDLANLIRKHVPEGQRESWAVLNSLDMRVIRCVLAEDQQWSSLLRADEICCALGLRIDTELTVIPGGRANAARKMATDELEVAFEFGFIPTITADDIEKRVVELEALRVEVLGAPTQDQIDRASRDRQRQTQRTKPLAA